MKRLLILLVVFLMTISFAFAAELNYNYFIEDGDLNYVDGGLLYIDSPDSTLEGSVVRVGALFLPQEQDTFVLSLSDDLTALNSTFFTADDAPNNDSYVIFTWDVVVNENKTLLLEIKKPSDVIYETELKINSRKRDVLDKLFSQKVIELDSNLPENKFEIRKKLSLSGFDITEDEFEEYFENAKTLDVKKSVETNKLLLEGNITQITANTFFSLNDIKDMEIYVIEFIDKEFAHSAYDLLYSEDPIVLDEDPLIMWHLVGEDEKDLEYEIKTETDVDQEITGNTILLAKDIAKNTRIDVWKILLAVLLIPLVAFLIIYFGNVNILKKN